ncbi:hypothetical protein MUA31_11310 [Staphylococcus simulans]|uniref:hypothetical protein n=2 Tax=Staphylococcus simulans TaxID=1286 RepID=UPI0021D36BA7|nr:hypothetical protein [Staphylococcus simulans]UXR34955.1 hypothetical protein MUA31_11310 [Staphylococcus simulans]
MKEVSYMATKSFTTEYKFTAKSAPNLLKAIEQQENLKEHSSKQTPTNIVTVTNQRRISSILESYRN